MKRTELENGKEVREDTVSHHRTLRQTIADVLKQASISRATSVANISATNRNAAANQQSPGSAEQSSESGDAIQYGRGE